MGAVLVHDVSKGGGANILTSCRRAVPLEVVTQLRALALGGIQPKRSRRACSPSRCGRFAGDVIFITIAAL
jgi:hypothetical protein